MVRWSNFQPILSWLWKDKQRWFWLCLAWIKCVFWLVNAAIKLLTWIEKAYIFIFQFCKTKSCKNVSFLKILSHGLIRLNTERVYESHTHLPTEHSIECFKIYNHVLQMSHLELFWTVWSSPDVCWDLARLKKRRDILQVNKNHIWHHIHVKLWKFRKHLVNAVSLDSKLPSEALGGISLWTVFG